MRLINVHDLEMREFFEDDRPPYAILSHTWDVEEVTYQDFQDLETAKDKAAWPKIQNAVQLTKEEGLDWLWTDTCCIDKSSSAELQEAINSMYGWYGDSHVCFAFLTDMSCPSAIKDKLTTGGIRESLGEPQRNSPEDWSFPKDLVPLGVEQGLRKLAQHSDSMATADTTLLCTLREFLASCRWFTRGWTLQELVAPKILRFFDQDYSFVGFKHDLSHILMQITGINSTVLQGHAAIADISVAQRMSWAAGRKTSRIEDRAYALLGIFDVNMPMIYGEGSKAFTRLQEEIIKTSDDDSIFAWETKSLHTPHSGALLAPSPDNFKHAGDIVVGGRPTSFELLNGGLRIELPLRKAFVENDLRNVEFAALLNCHHEADQRGTLALRLQKPETSEQFCLVEGTQGSRLAFDVSPSLQSNSRLAFITSGNLATCELRALQIARSVRHLPGVVFKVRLCSGSDLPCGARVIKAYPNVGWDPDHLILRTTPWDRMRAGVVYECQSGARLAVVFGYDKVTFDDVIGVKRQPMKKPSIWAHHYYSDIKLFAQFCDSHVPFAHKAPYFLDLAPAFKGTTTAQTRAFGEDETLSCQISSTAMDVFTVQVEITKLCELETIAPVSTSQARYDPRYSILGLLYRQKE